MTNFIFVFLCCTLLNLAVSLRSNPLFHRIIQRLCGSSSSSPPDENATTKAEENGDEATLRLRNMNDHHPTSTKCHRVSDEGNDVRRDLLRRYLVVYLLATFSDWLQGPYVYVLYEAYGFTQRHIAMLFVTGYAASMVFGSFLGGMADEYGRKRFVILYCIVYAGGCVTKHFNNFYILVVGRVLSGIATSLLFTVFEAWLIGAHANTGLTQPVISSYFSAASYGNSLVAILAGLISHRIATEKDLQPTATQGILSNPSNPATNIVGKTVFYAGGFLNPFDLAAVTLCLCGVAALFLWEENFGDQRWSSVHHGGGGSSGGYDSESSLGDDDKNNVGQSPRIRRRVSCIDHWKRTARTILCNQEILLCCCVSCLFEGSMYIFVFMWTPALTQLASPYNNNNNNAVGRREGQHDFADHSSELPVGIIFSTFMVSCMVGSSVFTIALEKGIAVEVVVMVIMVISSATMLTIAWSNSETLTFLAMNLFEVCVGMYFPTMGTVKSAIVPECSRAGIYSMCRVPLNVIVLAALLSHTSVVEAFGICTIMLLIASVLQYWLVRLRISRLQDGSVDIKEKKVVVAVDVVETGAAEYDMVEVEEVRKDSSLLRERKVMGGSSPDRKVGNSFDI